MCAEDVDTSPKLPLTLGERRTFFKREFMLRKIKTSTAYKDMAQRRLLNVANKKEEAIEYPQTPRNVDGLPKSKWEKQFRVWKMAVSMFPNHEKIRTAAYDIPGPTAGIFQ